MHVRDKVVVVTGGGDGIGAAMCRRFALEGARTVVVTDLDRERASAVAAAIGGVALGLDVGDLDKLDEAVATIEDRHGAIDLFCSNAGVGSRDPDPSNAASAPDVAWQQAWQINVMAHVHAARLLVPRMRPRGGGYLLNTISAAGLLSQIGNSVYSATKHAAVGFAESLAIAHGDDGIRVSILCPQGVDTAMLRRGGASASQPQNLDGVLTADQVADAVVQGLQEERFLILPHPQVAGYMQRKADDYDRWLGGMRRLRGRMAAIEG